MSRCRVPAPAAPAARTPLGASGLDDICVDAGAAGAGGADCAPVDPQTALRVEVPVDTAPAGIDAPALETDRIDCTRVPDLPLTQCTNPGDR